MYVCILNHDGEIVVHRNMPTSPEALLKTIAPYGENMVIAVECIFTWYGLADLCAREGLPFVLGHALSMKAIHGGKAKHDNIDAQNIAILLRGGMLPSSLCLSRCAACHTRPAAAPDTSHAQTGGAVDACPADEQPGQLARDR